METKKAWLVVSNQIMKELMPYTGVPYYWDTPILSCGN